MEKFRSTIFGYNREEVNEFVDTTLKEYAVLLSKYKKVSSELDTLRERHPDISENIRIVSDASNKIRDIAHNEAKKVVEDAEYYASRIISDALSEAERIKRETLDAKRNLNIFKNQLRKQLNTIEDIDKIDIDV